MTDQDKRQANAEAQARLRHGVKYELRQIRAELQDLRGDLREVLATRMIRKSLPNSECQHGD